MRYTERPTQLVNIGAAARQAEISSARFRRAVKTLRIPVYRAGWLVLIEKESIARVKRAFKDREIVRGRPKKKARN